MEDLERTLRAAVEAQTKEQWNIALRKLIHDLNNVSGTMKLALYSLDNSVKQLESGDSAVLRTASRRALSSAEGLEEARGMLDGIVRALNQVSVKKE